MSTKGRSLLGVQINLSQVHRISIQDINYNQTANMRPQLKHFNARLTNQDLNRNSRLNSMSYTNWLGFLLVGCLLVELVASQCPWRRDALELHSDCICDFSPSQSNQPNEPMQAHPINRMSIQCSSVNYQQLLGALKQTASIELPVQLLHTSLDSNISDSTTELVQQLVSQTKLDLLHVSNSSLGILINRTFLIDAPELGSTSPAAAGENSLLVVAIQSLHLSRCGILSIEPDAFMGLQWTLTSLSLSDNLLEQIPVQALERLRRLKVLDLSNNRLAALGANSFRRLNRLTTLRLADNRIAVIANQVARPTLPLSELTFAGLEESLVDLNLKNTQLASFPALAIKNLRKLAFLNLAQNQIAAIPSDSFSRMNSLTAINLERNRISSLNEGTFTGVENSLSSLSLLGNLLDSYPVEQLSKLSNLRRLDLGFNNIEILPHNAFSFNKRLILIALDGNPLETLPETTFKPLEGSLRGVSVGGKVLNCDCRLSWMLRWQREFSLQISSRERSPQFCAKPHYLRSLVSFNALKPEHLTCDQDEPKFSIEPQVSFPRGSEGLSTASWLANSELQTSYFTLPADIGPTEALAGGGVSQSRRVETTTRYTTLIPLTTTLKPHPTSLATMTLHEYPENQPVQPAHNTTELTMLLVESPTTSNLLHQLETSATTLQLLHGGMSNLPDDELFIAVDPQRKMSRHGYVHHSQRIKNPAKETRVTSSNLTNSATTTSTSTPSSKEASISTAKAKLGTLSSSFEPGARIVRPSPYGSFGNRATNLSSVTNQYRYPVNNSARSSSSSTDHPLAKGARFVEETLAHDSMETQAPLLKVKNRATLKSQAQPDSEKAPTMAPTTPTASLMAEMELHRVVESSKLTTSTASSTWTPSVSMPLTTQASPNNTRMSVSSIYRLAVSSPKPSLLTSSTPSVSESKDPSYINVNSLGTSGLASDKNLQEATVTDPSVKVRMAATVRMVTSSSNASSPVPVRVELGLGETTPRATQVSPTPTVSQQSLSSTARVRVVPTPSQPGAIVEERKRETQLIVNSKTSNFPPLSTETTPTLASRSTERQPEVTSINSIIKVQPNLVTGSQQEMVEKNAIENKIASSSRGKSGSSQVAPRMLNRIVNLGDYDRVALICAAILGLLLFVITIFVTCLCYSARSNIQHRNRTGVDLLPGTSKQQLRDSFVSSLESSSSTDFQPEAKVLCCFSSKKTKAKHRHRFTKRSLVLEDDNSSGAGSAGSGAQKSSASSSSVAKSTTLLTPDNCDYPAFATVVRTKRQHRSVQLKGRQRQVHSFDSQPLQADLVQLSAANSLQPLNHSEVLMRQREAHLANLEYCATLKGGHHLDNSSTIKKAWIGRRNSSFQAGSASSISCDSDKSCSPGANRNNHYNISEAHRVYLSDACLPIETAMFVSTAGQTGCSTSRKSGLLKTMDVYHHAEAMSGDRLPEDSQQAPSSLQQAHGRSGSRLATCRPDTQISSDLTRNRSNQTGSNYANEIKQRPPGLTSACTNKIQCEDYLNSDLVPMSAEDHWPEPYVDPLIAPESDQSLRGREPNQAATNLRDQHALQEKIRSQDVRAASTRNHTHRRTASSSYRPSAYDDAYLSNWNTMNSRGGRESSQAFPVDDYRGQRQVVDDGSALARYRSIPSLAGENASIRQFAGATNWLRWTPTNEIRSSSRAPVIPSSNTDDLRLRTSRPTLNQEQEQTSAGWFGENQLEAIYVASTSQALH